MGMYAKPNSIIAYGNFERNFAYDYVEGAKLVIYQLEDGKNTQCKIYDKDAKLELTVMAERKGESITDPHTDTDKNFTVERAEE